MEGPAPRAAAGRLPPIVLKNARHCRITIGIGDPQDQMISLYPSARLF
jgi:hypothetical protein